MEVGQYRFSYAMQMARNCVLVLVVFALFSYPVIDLVLMSQIRKETFTDLQVEIVDFQKEHCANSHNNFVVFGQRHSGTSLTVYQIQTRLCGIHSEMPWKHSLIDSFLLSKHTGYTYFVITKNPYSQLVAMWKTPFSVIPSMASQFPTMSFEQFVHIPWNSSELEVRYCGGSKSDPICLEQPLPKYRFEIAGVYDNIVHMRTMKNEAWRKLGELIPNRVFYIRYESAALDFEPYLQKFSLALDWKLLPKELVHMATPRFHASKVFVPKSWWENLLGKHLIVYAIRTNAEQKNLY
jgi:hypothetical protein